MDVIVLAPSEESGRQWQYSIENLGADWRCMPLTSGEAALACMESWVDLLLLLPCRESRMLQTALTESPPLAPPFMLGAEGPDGPLPAPEELPELMRTWRREGCIPVMAEHHLAATMEIASALFRTLEIPGRLRAWRFLPEMCALTALHPPLLSDLQHGLYPLIARRHGMTTAGVERSLRLCVESTWMHGSLAALERFFGSSVDPERGKPTNREFLCCVAERLTLTMQRLV